MLAEADEVVITAVPDLANLRNTKNLFDALIKLRPNDKLPHLVLNQVGMPKRPEIAPADFLDPLEIEPVAIIPFDTQLFGNAANSGRMISEMDEKSQIAETFSQIAHTITGRTILRKTSAAVWTSSRIFSSANRLLSGPLDGNADVRKTRARRPSQNHKAGFCRACHTAGEGNA